MLPPSEESRLARHASKGLILDSNLLIIYLVGLFNEKYVEHFLPGNKTKGRVVCLPGDFAILKSFTLRYRVKKFIVTPQILTEVSNLTFDAFEADNLQQFLSRAFGFFRVAKESHIPKDELLNTSHLPTVGFSDSSIIETAKNDGCLVLTVDFTCMKFLERAGCCVYNMNHLRTLRL